MRQKTAITFLGSLLLVLCNLPLPTYAEPPCKWLIEGHLDAAGFRGSRGFDTGAICPLEFEQVRVSARWSNGCIGECPFNTHNWGQATTDASGDFLVISSAIFLGNECTRSRDIRFEIRDSDSNWHELAIFPGLSGSNPNSVVPIAPWTHLYDRHNFGPLTPPPIDDDALVGEFPCGFVEITGERQPVFERATPMPPVEITGERQPVFERATPMPSPEPTRDPGPLPPGLGNYGGTNDVCGLRILDVQVTPRHAMELRRVSIELIIANFGDATYPAADSACLANLHFSNNEGPGVYENLVAFESAEPIEDEILPGGEENSITYAKNATSRGVSSVPDHYQYVLWTLFLQPAAGSAPVSDQISVCYDVHNSTMVDLSACSTTVNQ